MASPESPGMWHGWLRPFAVRNYRWYFGGHVLACVGSSVGAIADIWLLVTRTRSGIALGAATAVIGAVVVAGGIWGGLLAGRVGSRRLLAWTQAGWAVCYLLLFVLFEADQLPVWMLFAACAAFGVLYAGEIPASSGFAIELVGEQRVVNAVGVSEVVPGVARMLGAAVAGLLINAYGVGACFLLSALMYAARVVALRMIDPAALQEAQSEPSGRGQLRSGFAHVRSTSTLRIPLALMAVVGVCSLSYQIVVPLLASRTLHAGAGWYATLGAAAAIGTVVGALVVGARRHVKSGVVAAAAIGLGALELLAAVAFSQPLRWLSAVSLVGVGALASIFLCSIVSHLQLAAVETVRGRVMGVYASIVGASTATGGMLLGAIADVWDPRGSLVVAGAVALIAGSGASVALARATR